MTRKCIPALLLTLVLAPVGNALWLAEMFWRIGWEGTYWLRWHHFSVYGVVALLVIAYLAPISCRYRPKRSQLWAAALELYATSVVVFLIAKALMYSFYSRVLVSMTRQELLLVFILLIVLTAFSFFYTTRRWLYHPSWRLPVWLGAAMVAAPMMASELIEIAPAFSSTAGIVGMVKMGYPFGAIIFTMGLASWIEVVFPAKSNQPSSNDILDDPTDDTFT